MRKSILIILFALLNVLIARAYDFEVDGIYYNRISDTSVRVTWATTNSTDYGEVPTGLDYSGSVVIPSTVTYNESSYSVTSIEQVAFYNCSGLTSVTIPESVTSIGDWAFGSCSGLTAVTIPDGVTSIGNYAFDGCSNLTSVTIAKSVTSIGDYAFMDCKGLTSVTIPEGVTTIGDNAFYGTSISTPLYTNKVFAYLPPNYSGAYSIPSGIQLIAGGAFHGCTGLTSVTIPEGVTSIGWGAFSICTSLKSVTIPEGVDIIRDFTFYRCSSLISVTIPESVTSIGRNAFYQCSSLTSVVIPVGVDTIWGYTFYGCSGLMSVTIPESVTAIGDWAFENCTSLTSLTIPNSVTTIGRAAFSGCTGLTSVTIPESVISIGNSAFYGCSSLTAVTIPEGVDTIRWSTFYNCSGLTSVTIPESVAYIGDYAFYGCSGLTAVQWNAVACRDFSSDNPPFPNGENITSITFGKQVEHIPAYLCYGHSGLTDITLPKSLDTIGKYAFYGCNKLLSVTSLSKVPPYCASDNDPVFSFYEGTLFVPRGCKMAYQTAQEWYKFSRIEETETTYTVTVQPNDAVMGRVTGGGEYQEGEQAMLAAIPNQGYYFAKWDDGSTNNPRIMTVNEDITLTAIFAKNGDNPTANENAAADNFRVYVQNRTIHLSEDRGSVQVYNMAGQCVYNGHATAIPVQHAGVYVLRVADGRSRKIIVR